MYVPDQHESNKVLICLFQVNIKPFMRIDRQCYKYHFTVGAGCLQVVQHVEKLSFVEPESVYRMTSMLYLELNWLSHFLNWQTLADIVALVSIKTKNPYLSEAVIIHFTGYSFLFRAISVKNELAFVIACAWRVRGPTPRHTSCPRTPLYLQEPRSNSQVIVIKTCQSASVGACPPRRSLKETNPLPYHVVP